MDVLIPVKVLKKGNALMSNWGGGGGEKQCMVSIYRAENLFPRQEYLNGFAQTHLVSKDRSTSIVPAVDEPIKSLLLVGGCVNGRAKAKREGTELTAKKTSRTS